MGRLLLWFEVIGCSFGHLLFICSFVSLRLTFYDEYRLQFVNFYAWRLNVSAVLRISVNPVENLLLTFRLSADYKRKMKLPDLKLDN